MLLTSSSTAKTVCNLQRVKLSCVPAVLHIAVSPYRYSAITTRVTDAGAIWELHESAAKAQGQRANCQLLDSFMQDVMRTLDNQGRSLQSSDPLQLANMLELVEAAIDMLDTCNKPGMLFCAHGHWQRSV